MSKEIRNSINRIKGGFINESSINRIYDHILKHDSAIISSHRKDDNTIHCISTKKNIGDNKNNNRELKAILLKLGYGVTFVDGSYIEDYNTPLAKEVQEDSFFVLNMKEDSNFNKNLIKLSELYCQDSVILIEKGGEDSYLFGTNKGSFPGYGNKHNTGRFHVGEHEFMSRVKDKAFHFDDEKSKAKKTLPHEQGWENRKFETYDGLSNNSKRFVTDITKEIINEYFK